jgi:L-rhamnose-H+ transport protein
VAVCGRAALLREASQKKEDEPESGEQQKPQMTKGILVAFISGVLCACYAMAASFGGPVQTASETQFGNEPWRAAFAVTAVILWGGALSACGACVFKMAKNKTWGSLAKPGIGRVLVVAFIMALLHDGAILFFIIGASNLGKLGVAVGYAVFMSFAIIVGNVNGFLTGEWKGASKASISWLAAGILVLVLGVSTLKYGDFVQIKADEAAKAKTAQELPVSPEAKTPTKPE